MAPEIRPDPFHGVEFRTVGRQVQECHVGWNAKALGNVPAGLVQYENHMFVRSDLAADELQMSIHVLCVDGRGKHGRGFARDRVHRCEQVDPIIFGLLDRGRS